MKRSNYIRIIAFILVLALCLPTTAGVLAQDEVQRSSAYLDQYNAYIYDCGGGDFQVWFSVGGMAVMDQIGALTVIIKESSDNGVSWHTVQTYRHTAYPSMLGSNRLTYLSCVEYTGTVGYKYFAYVTVWAGRNGGGDSRQFPTPAVRLTQAGQG